MRMFRTTLMEIALILFEPHFITDNANWEQKEKMFKTRCDSQVKQKQVSDEEHCFIYIYIYIYQGN